MAAKKPVTETELKQMELTTGELIAKAPKVTVMIALDSGDPMWRGCINGYNYQFPKGQLVEVPEPVAEVIKNSARMQIIKSAHEQAMVNHVDLGSM